MKKIQPNAEQFFGNMFMEKNKMEYIYIYKRLVEEAVNRGWYRKFQSFLYEEWEYCLEEAKSSADFYANKREEELKLLDQRMT